MTNAWGNELNVTMTDTLDYTRQWVETTESRMSELERQKEKLLMTSTNQIHSLIGEFNSNVHAMVIKVEECLRKWESTFQCIQQLSQKATDGEKSDVPRRTVASGVSGFRRIGMAAAAGFKLIGTAAGLKTILADTDQQMTEAIVGLAMNHNASVPKKSNTLGRKKFGIARNSKIAVNAGATVKTNDNVGVSKKADTTVVVEGTTNNLTNIPITADAAIVSVDLPEDVLNNLANEYEKLKDDCKQANVNGVDAFKLLLEAVEQLIKTDRSIAGSLEMSEFIIRVISSGQAFLKIYKLSKYFSNKFIMGITKQSIKQKMEPDINSLERRKQNIQKSVKELSQSITKQLHDLNKTIKVGDKAGNQIKYRNFINQLENNFHTITEDIEQCQRLVASMETKFQENSKKNKDVVDGTEGGDGAGKTDTGAAVSARKMGSAFVMGGLKAMGGAIVAIHPVTFAAGIAGFGIVKSVQVTRRKIIKKTTEKLGAINDHLTHCHKRIKSRIKH